MYGKDERVACCLAERSRCGTDFASLRAWVCRSSGKGVKLQLAEGQARGKHPYYAQPVGYDGRTFHVAVDHGCDTEKLLHEVCHFMVAPKERRNRENYGLGPGEITVDPVTSDNEEVTVMLLELLLAPHFRLDHGKIARPDYNTHDRRNVDWPGCQARAQGLYKTALATLSSP
jgi:hypothetical protein